MIQHPLHLLVDLIGRRAAQLLVLGSASLALRHAQFFRVSAFGRLPARLSLAAGQGGGGCGHLWGEGVSAFSLVSWVKHPGRGSDEDVPGTSESGPRSSSAGPHRRDEL